jgi:pimeloyl-ACP methyl ester carboxylesterase
MRQRHSEPIEPRQLEAFAAVLSTGSFTSAARLLARSQPAITRLVQELEACIGYPLFVRKGPRVSPTEALLRQQPAIAVPTVCLQGGGDGVFRAEISAAHRRFFTGPYERRVLDHVGHNVPQEAPEAFAQAVLGLVGAP